MVREMLEEYALVQNNGLHLSKLLFYLCTRIIFAYSVYSAFPFFSIAWVIAKLEVVGQLDISAYLFYWASPKRDSKHFSISISTLLYMLL